MITARILTGLFVLCSGALASAQCPVQELNAQVPDFGHFGLDLALSGSEMIVGSAEEQAAFLFEETGAGWQQTSRFDPPIPADAIAFGGRVGLSGDTAVVSDTRAADGGLVHVYVRSGASWVFQQTIKAADGEANDFFGAAVAVDGDRIAARKYVGFEWAVHIYERTAGVWAQTKKLTRPNLNFFGMSLDLEGDRLLVGDSGDQDEGFNTGAAYIYERQGNNWSMVDKVFPSPAGRFDNAFFGTSVALDGDRAVVGSPAYLAPGEKGSAYVFQRVGNNWMRKQRLQGAGATADNPVAVRVALEGDRLVLSDFGDQALDVPGSVYVFDRTGGEWQQIAELRRPAGGNQFDRFGYSVGLRGDHVYVGSPNDGPGVEQGAVHDFDLTNGAPVNYCQSTVNSTGRGATIASIGSTNALANDVTLLARNVPDQNGFFIVAGATRLRPLFDGFLCVGAPLARLPVIAASGGELQQQVDLGSLPFNVVAGSTWHFQAWFLDPAAGGTGANLSDGVTVTFCP